MYEQKSLQQSGQGELVGIEGARALRQAAGKVLEGVRNFATAIAEPFRGPLTLELLDPKVRSKMTARERGEIDAHFHGL